MYKENFLISVIVEVGNVLRVTMAASVIHKHRSVIIKNRTAEYNLITSVIIDIRNGNAVRALTV